MASIAETHIENRVSVQPNDTNYYDIAHGGNVMKWMDESGALSAMRFAGETCVTARMESVDFHRPIPRGDTALIESFVYDAGETSVSVHIRVYREDPMTGERELTTESDSVFVALDEDRTPTAVPDLEVETDLGERLRREAFEEDASVGGVGADTAD